MQILSGANTYTGGTTINGGTLIAESNKALGTGNVSVAAGSTLDYMAPNNNVKLNITGTLTIAAGTTGATIGASIGSGGNNSTQDQILASGIASTTGSGNITLNLYGAPRGATGTTINLIGGAAGSTLNGDIHWVLGTVYNNVAFTVNPGTLAAGTTSVTVGITAAGTPLTTAFWDAGGYSTAPAVMAAGNGSTTSNWSILGSPLTPQGLIPGSGASVTFGANSTTAVTLGANMSITGLTLADTSSHAFTLNADGNTLTIGTGGITINSGVTTASTIAASLALGGSQIWTNPNTTAAKALTVSGVISGATANTLTTAGAGTIILSGANTFTGPTTIGATSTLQLSNANALQSSIVSLGANNDLTFASGIYNFNLGGLSGGFNEALTDASSNAVTLSLGSNNTTGMTYSGNLSGIGGLTKVGTGTQTLTGTNTFTGLLSLNGGVLNVTSAAMNASTQIPASPSTAAPWPRQARSAPASRSLSSPLAPTSTRPAATLPSRATSSVVAWSRWAREP